MAISDNIHDRDKKAYKENTTDGGLDRRVTDVTTQGKLDEVVTAIENITVPAPVGGATEATLVQVRDAVDQLEGYLDQTETLLTDIDNNTDGLEGLATTANGLLTSIRDNADTVETLLTNIDSNTDGLESLVASTNSLLTTIRDNADTVETLLTDIGNNTDTIESLISSSNALLTTIRDNADTIESLITITNTEIGVVTETAPATDTASSGLNGRLQRIAQRLTSLLGIVATETTLAAVAASLSVIDDWDETDRAKVNLIVGQTGVQGASGVVTGNTQRVVLATDVPLPTGTNSIGQITTNAAVGTLTNRSGSVGTTSTQIIASNSTRKYLFIQCQSGTIWINFGTTATTAQPSIRLNSGDVFVMEGSFIATDAVHAISTGGTRDFAAKEA